MMFKISFIKAGATLNLSKSELIAISSNFIIIYAHDIFSLCWTKRAYYTIYCI